MKGVCGGNDTNYEFGSGPNDVGCAITIKAVERKGRLSL